MRQKFIFWIGAALLVVFVATLSVAPFFLSGCSTVHQKYVEPASEGFYVKPVAVPGGFLVDSAFRDRYNAMVELYGNKKLENGAPVFLPPLRKDDGVRESGIEGRWFMSEAAMENMVILSDMKRRGSAP